MAENKSTKNNKSQKNREELCRNLIVKCSPEGARLQYPGKAGLNVPLEIWNSWKPNNWQDDTSSVLELKIPLYLLRFMESRIDDREFEVREDGLQEAGQHIIIESIGEAGAVFLVTREGQSELAFPVTGYDVVCFDGAKYMAATSIYTHTQYVCEIRPNLMQDWVYTRTLHQPNPKSMLRSSTTVGETIRYGGAMKVPTAFSHWVSNLSLSPTLLRI